MRLDEVFHFRQCDPVRYSFLLKEAIITLSIFLVRGVSVGLCIINILTLLEAVLHLVKPAEYIRPDGANLEEHGQALLEIALQLLEKDSELEQGC